MTLLRKIILAIATGLLIVSIVAVSYTSNPYTASNEMYELIDTSSFTEYTDHYQFYNQDGQTEIIIMPGGLVDASSYLYLGYKLYLAGFEVTIVKPPLYLAIIQPNQVASFISNYQRTVLIGHSLGGVVAANAANKYEVDALVLLASYAMKDVNDIDVLALTGTKDLILDIDRYQANKSHFDTAIEVAIDGGNHAQFGWYGEQKGDGNATITVKQQQDLIVQEIITFLGGNYDN